jgi:glycosyltransferase involved in cell wall biosynthesis
MDDTTVIIKTIGRPTLKAAIKSAKREGFKTLVVSDGRAVSAQGANRVITLGKNWGYYGGMAANVGAALARTEFITFLDDDDEFIVGAGETIRSKLKESPETDVWIGGVRFTEVINMKKDGVVTWSGTDVALDSEKGVSFGNVCMPTYRTSIFSKLPFVEIPEKDAPISDYLHIKACKDFGYSVDWFGKVVYLVRPKDKGVNGGGL